MKKKLTMLLLALCMTASMMATAYAAEPLEYTIDGAGNPEYGKATSIEVVHTPGGGAMKNEDVSGQLKLAAGAGSVASRPSSTGSTGWRGVPSKIATYRVLFRAILLTVPV